jgi:ribosomal protein S18 acetylase RimI-like enzyme
MRHGGHSGDGSRRNKRVRAGLGGDVPAGPAGLAPLRSALVASPQIEIADRVTPELVDAIGRLLPQLSSSAPAPTEAELAEIVAGPATLLFLARVDGKIVGSLTLVVFRLPSGVRAWIEDVVVDGAARGHGVGEALNRAAIAEADARGARTLDLTSRPSREAANRLYQRLGFQARESTVYRYTPG